MKKAANKNKTAISDKENIVMEAIVANPKADNKTLVEKTGIGRETIRLTVKKLIEAGKVIATVGENKAMIFIAKGSEKNITAKKLVEQVTKKPEPEVKVEAKKEAEPIEKRVKTQADNDRKKLVYKGVEYGKGKAVLAVITDYVKAQKTLPTGKQVQEVWLNRFHRKYGCIKPEAEAIEKSKTQKRFFTREDQMITLADGRYAVTSDWGVKNVEEIVRKANDLGLTMTWK